MTPDSDHIAKPESQPAAWPCQGPSSGQKLDGEQVNRTPSVERASSSPLLLKSETTPLPLAFTSDSGSCKKHAALLQL